MRSIRTLSAVTGLLVLASACGDGGGTPPPDNEAPVANFALPVPPCTINVPCTFTDASTDDVGVTGWSWDFNGDGTADATANIAPYTYTTAGTFTVILTVRDVEGLTGTKANAITIAPIPPVNTPPTAGFTSSCTDATCTFTSTSTDVAPGTIASYLWNFGDGGEATTEDASHTYAVTAATDFTVTLTVTDNEGASDVETQTVTATPPPPATTECSSSGFEVDCTLDIVGRSTVRLQLSGIDCELVGNRITIPPPVGETAFFNLCSRSIGEAYTILDDTGAPLVFAAGTSVTIRFHQGTGASGVPAARYTGIFPSWTINIDDGGNAGGPGEPDYTDVVLTVQATAAR